MEWPVAIGQPAVEGCCHHQQQHHLGEDIAETEEAAAAAGGGSYRNGSSSRIIKGSKTGTGAAVGVLATGQGEAAASKLLLLQVSLLSRIYGYEQK